MQTSGTCGPLSDGARKTIVGATPPAKMPAMPKPSAAAGRVPASSVSTHRRGGFHQHQKSK